KYSFKTQIGENSLLMAYVHVAHDSVVGKNCILANNVTLAGHINVGDYAVLGGLTAIHQFVNIGRHSFISGGSLVRKDVPSYVKAAREPLSYVGVNSIGLRRRGFDSEKINHIQDIYRILFVRGYNTTQAMGIIEADFPATDVRDEILTFIRDSERGIMKGFYQRNEDNA
ncbi:MAG: acyl-[acyl-carrier-protein]--UDP-N-acetylglucosamine O-acyltransferase, partial [Bacteroidetes bacterium]|nr:acyl-[acyl-carrier-protein]--UDP-N-acetylglucosamine O-acyltransferase [Bacteroidota bacterium]